MQVCLWQPKNTLVADVAGGAENDLHVRNNAGSGTAATIEAAVIRLCEQAAIQGTKNRAGQAGSCARLAVSLARRSGEQALLAWALLHLAIARMLAHELPSAIFCSRAAESVWSSEALSAQPCSGRVLLLNNQAVLLANWGRYAAAHRQFSAALALLPEAEQGLRARIFHNRAALYVREAKVAQAIEESGFGVKVFAGLRHASVAQLDLAAECLALLLLSHATLRAGQAAAARRAQRQAQRLSGFIDFAFKGSAEGLRARIVLQGLAVDLAELEQQCPMNTVHAQPGNWSRKRRSRLFSTACRALRSAKHCCDRKLQLAATLLLIRAARLCFPERVASLLPDAQALADTLGRRPAELELRRRLLREQAIHLEAKGDAAAAYRCCEAERRLWRYGLEQMRVREREFERRTDDLENLRCKNAEMHARGRSLADGNRALENLNTQIRKLEDERRALLELTAHDLKNPLAALLLEISLLQNYAKRMQPAERETRVRSVHSAVLRLREIIDDVLHAHTLTEFAESVENIALDPTPLLSGILIAFEAKAASKNIKLISEYTPGICCLASRKALRHAVENLISNAVKFSPAGRSVRLQVLKSERGIQIRVLDEGRGVPQAEQQRLFTPYARLSNRPTGGEHSTGLGLALVKKLMESMQGSVWYEDADAGGACFVLELPEAACR